MIMYMLNAFLSAYVCGRQSIFIMLAFPCILYFPPFFVYKMIEVSKTSNNGRRVRLCYWDVIFFSLFLFFCTLLRSSSTY